MLELTIRLVVSLAIVVGLLMLLARVGAKKFRGGSGALVHVVHRQPLSRTSAVAVVTVGTRVLVLGTTEQQVSVLAELDPEELELDDADVLSLVADQQAVELVETPGVQVTSVSTSSTGGHATGPTSANAPGARRPGSHRAGPAVRNTAAPASGALAGSVLSLQTWRQAINAARRAS